MTCDGGSADKSMFHPSQTRLVAIWPTAKGKISGFEEWAAAPQTHINV